MSPIVVIWLLSALVSVFVGFEVTKWALAANKRLEAKETRCPEVGCQAA